MWGQVVVNPGCDLWLLTLQQWNSTIQFRSLNLFAINHPQKSWDLEKHCYRLFAVHTHNHAAIRHLTRCSGELIIQYLCMVSWIIVLYMIYFWNYTQVVSLSEHPHKDSGRSLEDSVQPLQRNATELTMRQSGITWRFVTVALFQTLSLSHIP